MCSDIYASNVLAGVRSAPDAGVRVGGMRVFAAELRH